MNKILIKGNLILKTPPHCEVIVDATDDIQDAVVIEGDIKCDSINASLIYITGELSIIKED